MGTVTFVGSNYAEGRTSRSVAVAVPAATVAGDLLLLTCSAAQLTTSPSAISGWTLLFDAQAAGLGSQSPLRAWTRTAIAGDAGTTVDLTAQTSSTLAYPIWGTISAYRGVTQAPTYALAKVTASSSGSASAPTASTGDAVLSIAAGNVANAPSAESGSNVRQSRGDSGSTGSNTDILIADWLPGGTHTAGPAISGLAGSTVLSYATVVLINDRAPNAPTLNSPATNTTIDRGITQRFGWTFSDPDAGDSQSKFDLQYRLIGAPTWTTVSGTTPNTFYDFAASTFAAGNYEWQVRTYDSQGLVGPWSSSSFFTAASAPAQPTITAPVNGSTVPNTATLTWSAPNQTDYQWRRVADDGAGNAVTSTVYYDSGDVVDGTTRSVTVTFETNNRWEHVQVRIKNAGLWSTWADARVQVSYTPPTVATFTMSADPATATRTLAITNPAPGAGVPATAYNDVYCRTAASSTVVDTYRPYSTTGTRIGTALATNTPFVDRNPAGSPVVYEYRVVSVAVNGTTSDSGWQVTP